MYGSKNDARPLNRTSTKVREYFQIMINGCDLHEKYLQVGHLAEEVYH